MRGAVSVRTSTLVPFLEINMNGRRKPALAFAVWLVLALLGAPLARAQTGAAATRQMQDTQRKAQQKAREAKGNTHQNTNTQHEKKATPASGVQ